ncbi:COMM domain-containing protein 5 isoform X1 [Brienomyrus brachyistius]|uniref:COMM domain-containing protein 5 isoform X1 n=1 Tax=Brienomyrus brachyistius TaxID=42636 RepID=UPI0020B415E8|nr:COMM domain-containing protein 5 isoform X1 [Brienomyrus brachyistius]
MSVPGSAKGGVMAEGSGFLGGRIPVEIEEMARHIRDLDKELFRKILKAVVSAVEGKDCRDLMRSIAESSDVPEDRLSLIVAGMYSLLKEALRLPTSSLKQEVFKDDLRELRISEEFITDFASVVFGNRRTALEAAYTHQQPRLPSIEDLQWRVDVAISTSSLVRALQPSILMRMKLSDGKIHQFEVPISKFQDLRYNVALILKEMNDLEKRSILKIQD